MPKTKPKTRRTELTIKPGSRVRVGPVVIYNSGRLTNRGLRLGFEAPREVAILREELVGKDAERE